MRRSILAAVAILAAACANTPSTTQIAEQNAAVVRRAIEEPWNQKNFDNLSELYGAEYVSYTNGQLDTGTVEMRIKDVLTRYPDSRVTVDEVIATADRAVVRWQWLATDVPTGKPMKVAGTSVMRIADGKIVEGHGNYDLLGATLATGATIAPPAGVLPQK